MKIRIKLAIITSLAAAFTILFAILLSDVIIMTGFVHIEDSLMKESVERVNGALLEKTQSIDVTAHDYATWNASYDAITGENTQYGAADFATLENVNVDFALLMRNDGKIMFARDIFSGEQKDYNITTADLDSKLVYSYFENNHDSIICMSEFDDFNGVIQLPIGLALISSRPILKSDGTGPVQGTIIFGKMIDKSFIEALSNRMRVSISFHSYDSVSYEDKLKLNKLFSNDNIVNNVNAPIVNESNDSDDSDILVQILDIDENTISGNTLLKDIFGRPVALLEVIDQREVYLEGKTAITYIIQAILVGVMLFVIIEYFLFNKFIISRLVSMEHQMNDIQIKKLTSSRITITGNDELSSFSETVNATLDVMEKTTSEKNYATDLKRELDRKTQDMKKNLEELEASKKASLNIMDDLFETNKHLKDLDKAKTDFLNVASHELKTPLTAISAYLEILDDYKGQFNKDQLQGLDAIKRNSNQLKMLIGNILEISRLDSGRFDLNITEINVKEKITVLVDNLKILSDNKHIKLKYDCDSVEKINTDAMRFEEILNNLVGNAIKFTDKGSVMVKTEFGKDKEKRFVVISVIDTGIGIPKDKMHSLFQNFYQVDATTSRKHGGTGLGLAITKKMIELQGGKISVDSVVGKGTTFRFTLPIQQLKKLVPQADITTGTKTDIKVKSMKLVKPVRSDVESSTLQKATEKRLKRRLNSKQINRHTSKRKK